MSSSHQQAAVIRSSQKDEYYLGHLKVTAADLIQTILGAQRWIRWRREFDVIADVGYFALTTISGYQTLGEEYVGIIQVDGSRRAVPSTTHRILLVLLHTSVPYLIDRSLRWMEHQLRHNHQLNLTPDARMRLLDALPAIRHAVTIIHRCHLAIFYLRGIFYHIAKRLVGTEYLLLHGGGADSGRPGYRILGYLSIIQLTLTFLHQMYQYVLRQQKQRQADNTSERGANQRSDAVKVESPYVTAAMKCPLCLEARKHSTVTFCGHIFCWNCITEWALSKPECPLCREKFELSRLVCLQNYDLT